MNQLEVIILSVLEKKNASSMVTGICLEDLLQTEDFGYTGATFYKYIQRLKQKEYIGKGFKNGRKYTYYITEQGIKFLKELKGGLQH